VESEFFIESLCFSLCLLVKIKNLPSLVGSIVSAMNLNFLCFNILTLVNIKATVGLLDVAEVFSTVYKDLEPLRVSAPNLHVFGFA